MLRVGSLLPQSDRLYVREKPVWLLVAVNFNEIFRQKPLQTHYSKVHNMLIKKVFIVDVEHVFTAKYLGNCEFYFIYSSYQKQQLPDILQKGCS